MFFVAGVEFRFLQNLEIFSWPKACLSLGLDSRQGISKCDASGGSFSANDYQLVYMSNWTSEEGLQVRFWVPLHDLQGQLQTRDSLNSFGYIFFLFILEPGVTGICPPPPGRIHQDLALPGRYPQGFLPLQGNRPPLILGKSPPINSKEIAIPKFSVSMNLRRLLYGILPQI